MDSYKLDQLLKLRKETTQAEFADRYGGTCLVGVGMLTAPLEDGRGGKTSIIVLPVGEQSKMRREHAIVGRVFLLRPPRGQSRVVVGRAQNSDVVIPDYPISKSHCYFQWIDRAWVCVDNGSTNGTRVNGQNLEANKPWVLKQGDEILVGRYVFRFYLAVVSFIEEYVRNKGRLASVTLELPVVKESDF